MSRYMSSSDTLRQKSAVEAACVVNVDDVEVKTDPERPLVKLWFVDISEFDRTFQFLLLSTATFATYLIYGYLQVKFSYLYVMIYILSVYRKVVIILNSSKIRQTAYFFFFSNIPGADIQAERVPSIWLVSNPCAVSLLLGVRTC